MSSFPSHTVYQANAARCHAMEAEAANERRAAQVSGSRALVPQVIGSMQRRVGSLLITLGTWLLRVGDAPELKTALEP